MPLTGKQEAFVQEYLIDFNATQAAKRAGYSEKTAYSIGEENLRKPEIQEAISAAKKKRSERTEISQDRVLKEIARIALLDPRNVMEWGPHGVTHKPSSELSDDDAACIVEASHTVTENGGTIRVKLADKMNALALLGKHLDLFTDRHVHTGDEGGPIEVANLTHDQLLARITERHRRLEAIGSRIAARIGVSGQDDAGEKPTPAIPHDE